MISAELEGWEIISNGGDGFQCEEQPSGCKPLIEANPDAEGSAVNEKSSKISLYQELFQVQE